MENMINIIEKTKIDFYQYICGLFLKNEMLEEIVISLSKSHIIVKGKKVNELNSIRVESIKFHTPNRSIVYFPIVNQFSIQHSKIINFIYNFFKCSQVINLEFKHIILQINQQISQHDLFNLLLNTKDNNKDQKNETWVFRRKELDINKFSFFGELLIKKLEFLDYQHKLSLSKPCVKSSLKFKI